MIWVTWVPLLLALAAAAPTYDDATFGTLPPEMAEQIREMIKEFFVDLKANCTGLQEPTISFQLYTRSNPNDPKPINPSSPKEIDPRKKLVLFIHGWLSNTQAKGVSQLRNEYIKRYDVNFVSIDWSEPAWQLYNVSFCHVPKIGEQVADFLCLLSQQYKVRLSVVHLIGHSMGAQISGYVGQYLASKCQENLGRITGLDPSAHLFEYLSESVRLDKSDAEFVDVIHTDSFGFGYVANCGAVDFHPNCALPQPGCPSVDINDNKTLISDALCSQHRAVDYMAESVNSQELVGVSCSLCSRYCHPDIINEVYQVMGEDCREIPKPAKNFLIPTNSAPPYGKGLDAYPITLSKSLLCKNVSKPRNVFLRKICNVHYWT